MLIATASGRVKQYRGVAPHTQLNNRGVAQLVARLLWEQDAAGSSPVTSTKNNQKNVIQRKVLVNRDFSLFLCGYNLYL